MGLSEQDAVTGPVPLPDVLITFLDQKWSSYDYPDYIEQKYPSPDHYVMSQCFAVLEDLSPEILEQAVKAMLLYHDVLRLRFVKQADRWIQHIVPPDEAIPLVWQDLSSIAKEKRQETIQSTLARELYSLNLEHGPVMKCVYLKQGGEEAGLLFLLLNHLVADMLSAQILVEDLHTVLVQLYHGQEILLPKKGTSIKTWGERVESCLHSKEWEGEIRRLIAYKRSWPPSTLRTLPLDYPDEKRDEQPFDQLLVSLEVEETSALLKQAGKVWKVRLLDLLQTALVKTIAPWAGTSSLPMCVVLHGRDPIFEDIDLSRTMGYFVLGLLEVLELKDDMQPGLSPLADPRLRFAQALLNFSRALEMTYESDGSEKYVSIYDQYNPQVILNVHGRVDSLDQPGQKKLLRPFSLKDWQEVNTRVASKSLDCVIAIEQKQLWATWEFSPRYFRRSTIEQLAQTYLKELRTFIGPKM
jgi:hypothetical protein